DGADKGAVRGDFQVEGIHAGSQHPIDGDAGPVLEKHGALWVCEKVGEADAARDDGVAEETTGVTAPLVGDRGIRVAPDVAGAGGRYGGDTLATRGHRRARLLRLDRTYQPFRVAAQGAADGRAGQERLLLAVPVDADELHVGEDRFENRRVAPGLDQQGSLRLNPHGEHQLIKDSSVHQADASSKSAMSASTQADSCFSASGTGSNVPVRRYAFSASLSSVASQRTVGDSKRTRPSPRPLKPPTSISPRASACSPRASSPSSALVTFSATTLSAKTAPG